MSGMVERVARALMAHLRADDGEDFYDAARAAIEAMRGATPEMIQAAHDEKGSDEWDVYTAMIDAAIKEGS
jgi:hypothetical protein